MFCHCFCQLPAVAEFSTGETMGHSGDRYRAGYILYSEHYITVIQTITECSKDEVSSGVAHISLPKTASLTCLWKEIKEGEEKSTA